MRGRACLGDKPLASLGAATPTCESCTAAPSTLPHQRGEALHTGTGLASLAARAATVFT